MNLRKPPECFRCTREDCVFRWSDGQCEKREIDWQDMCCLSYQPIENELLAKIQAHAEQQNKCDHVCLTLRYISDDARRKVYRCAECNKPFDIQ
jgi:predicted SprT family Zn-dependent metalloprotease